jgi:hypothetical protein
LLYFVQESCRVFVRFSCAASSVNKRIEIFYWFYGAIYGGNFQVR